ncbi:alpha/beta fold hydrolase [Herbaspirillum sp. RV1423]|uniref:alpha/beta fold hydrolase n=1 Tax=Herbaspirillum sp. RV1423 TaxID=1443993 RepID=UPI0004B3BED6|nr:alpha/beta hydrolase [Herbaspirillum sp. RV1423]
MEKIQYRMVAANGINMNVAEQGEGPVILLCHGFPETSYSWRHQMGPLAAAGFRAVAPDMRGYGKSDSPGAVELFSVEHLAADMVGLLNALDAKDAVIVGNDWGATVAWHAALRYPSRFRGLIALGVPMMPRAPAPPTQLFPHTEDLELYALYFQDEGRAEKEFETSVNETLVKILYAASGEAGPREQGDGTPNPFGMVNRKDGLLASLPLPSKLPSWLTQDDIDVFTLAFEESGFRGGLNYYRNLDRNWALEASYSDAVVTVPSLYLVGERDTGLSIPGMKEIIASMSAKVPCLRGTRVIPDCGHWLPQERPDVVSQVILDFAKELGDGAA